MSFFCVGRLSIKSFFCLLNIGLNPSWCQSAEQGLIQPDLVFHLDADPTLLSKRKGFGEGENETLDLQLKVMAAFNTFTTSEHGYWIKIDATKKQSEIQTEIIHKVFDKMHLNYVNRKSIQLLWK